jgi:hypothetical protein
MALWVLLALVVAGRRLGLALDGNASFTGRVTWRLLASQFVVGWGINTALVPVSIALFYWG